MDKKKALRAILAIVLEAAKVFLRRMTGGKGVQPPPPPPKTPSGPPDPNDTVS